MKEIWFVCGFIVTLITLVASEEAINKKKSKTVG